MTRPWCAALRSGRWGGSILRVGGRSAPRAPRMKRTLMSSPNGSGSLRPPAERGDAGGAVDILALRRAGIDIARYGFLALVPRIEIDVEHAGRAGELQAPGIALMRVEIGRAE